MLSILFVTNSDKNNIEIKQNYISEYKLIREKNCFVDDFDY